MVIGDAREQLPLRRLLATTEGARRLARLAGYKVLRSNGPEPKATVCQTDGRIFLKGLVWIWSGQVLSGLVRARLGQKRLQGQAVVGGGMGDVPGSATST